MKDFQADISEYLPLREVVFHTLRRAILMGELEPGERLMELQLTQKLGVSRTPIREAIRRLELEAHEQLLQEHENILSCLKERRTDAARSAIREHITNQVQAVSRNIRVEK